MSIREKLFAAIRSFLFLVLLLSISGFFSLSFSIFLIIFKDYILIKNPEYIDESTAYLIIGGSLVSVFALYIKFKHVILKTYNGTLSK